MAKVMDTQSSIVFVANTGKISWKAAQAWSVVDQLKTKDELFCHTHGKYPCICKAQVLWYLASEEDRAYESCADGFRKESTKHQVEDQLPPARYILLFHFVLTPHDARRLSAKAKTNLWFIMNLQTVDWYVIQHIARQFRIPNTGALKKLL